MSLCCTCSMPMKSPSMSTAAVPRDRCCWAAETYNVDFKPAGGNTLKASGDFTGAKGMRVIVKTDKVGGQSFQARVGAPKLNLPPGPT